jgi:DNA polymerase-3 subunit epsilon
LSNEFIIESKLPKLGESEAIKAFIDYLGNAVIVDIMLILM